MLPTLTYMKLWQPYNYTTDVCRMCEREPEDNKHVWQCEATLEVQAAGWKDAVNNLNKDGKRAWTSEHKAWRAAASTAREQGRQFTQAEPKFSEANDNKLWTVLKGRVSDLQEILRINDKVIENPLGTDNSQLTWTVKELYQGLVPKVFTSDWKTTFNTTTSIARYIAGKFVRTIEESGRTDIWNERCKATIEWERENGITTRSKRSAERERQRNINETTQGQFGSFSSQQPAQQWTDVTAEVNERLLQSYFRETDLNVMERLDSCKFFITEDSG